MGEDDCPNAAWLNWERRPVLQAKRLKSLKQTAVDEDAMVVVFESILGTGDRPGASQKR